MKFKKIILILICGILLTGCGNKVALSAKEFTEIAENEELIISDAKEYFLDKDYLEDATIAASISGWQIEHYTMKTEEDAKTMYNNNKEFFESELDDENKKLAKEIEKDNYTIYSLTASGSFKYMCRIDNTVLYVNSTETNKKSIEKIINKLGY